MKRISTIATIVLAAVTIAVPEGTKHWHEAANDGWMQHRQKKTPPSCQFSWFCSL